MKAILKTNIIITQKKPQQNAEASTTTIERCLGG